MAETEKRKTLQKVTSPEQLDRLLVVVRFPGWIALLCLFLLIVGITLWAFWGRLSTTTEGVGIFFDPHSIEVIQNSSEGIIEKVYVNSGEEVKKGAPLFGVRSLDHKSRVVKAPDEGKVLMVDILQGQGVHFDENLIWFQKRQSENNLIYAFFSIQKGDEIKPGMRAQIQFDGIRAEIFGKMEGKVLQILPFAVNPESAILLSIPSKSLRDYLTRGEAPMIVIIEPLKDPSTSSGYKWTTQKGPDQPIATGSTSKVNIFLSEQRPITYLIPLSID